VTLQAQIAAVIASTIAGVESWKPTTNLGNIFSDAGDIVTTLETIDPNLIPQKIANDITTIPADAAALQSGQVAIIGNVPASFEGEEDDVMLFAVRKYKNSPPPAGSEAATIKQLLGT
jgi:hypothetical protein